MRCRDSPRRSVNEFGPTAGFDVAKGQVHRRDGGVVEWRGRQGLEEKTIAVLDEPAGGGGVEADGDGLSAEGTPDSELVREESDATIFSTFAAALRGCPAGSLLAHDVG